MRLVLLSLVLLIVACQSVGGPPVGSDGSPVIIHCEQPVKIYRGITIHPDEREVFEWAMDEWRAVLPDVELAVDYSGHGESVASYPEDCQRKEALYSVGYHLISHTVWDVPTAQQVGIFDDGNCEPSISEENARFVGEIACSY